MLIEEELAQGTVTDHGVGKDLYQLHQLVPLSHSRSGKVFKAPSNPGKVGGERV